MNIDKDNVDKIVDFLKYEVEPYLIYIFGSSVNGIFREDSDIDIAFMSDNEFSSYEIFMLAQRLADILKRDVDLINLNKASTVFKVQIIANGNCIYCSDDNKKAYFEMYAYKEYARLNEERQIILDNIKKRGQIYE
ncbi:nucleotidyltransferase domain-containing protein [Clostridium tyrobutyricum]|uniref:type VII toxin-antitoxin system MntA family adenylyltransferase antitoxin n=1 Tax=Clostridium tyrobutyricum TaxID=1519 RepID=UPI001C382CEE|nr:nucleotidyltransferase domain-containing protein [Clostridium tyrobutyricum]MBV4419802.1 nucleotidyltransferase domain-containing protein [Clostridium tyrobutyricum]